MVVWLEGAQIGLGRGQRESDKAREPTGPARAQARLERSRVGQGWSCSKRFWESCAWPERAQIRSYRDGESRLGPGCTCMLLVGSEEEVCSYSLKQQLGLWPRHVVR